MATRLAIAWWLMSSQVVFAILVWAADSIHSIMWWPAPSGQRKEDVETTQVLGVLRRLIRAARTFAALPRQEKEALELHATPRLGLTPAAV